MATLIDTSARVAEQDELTVYRSLVTADGDVVRVRAGEGDGGGVTLNAAVDLIGGVRDMLLWAACSLRGAAAGRTGRAGTGRPSTC